MNLRFIPLEGSQEEGTATCLVCQQDLGVCRKSDAYQHARSVHPGMKMHLFYPLTAAETERLAASKQRQLERDRAWRRNKRQQLKVGWWMNDHN